MISDTFLCVSVINILILKFIKYINVLVCECILIFLYFLFPSRKCASVAHIKNRTSDVFIEMRLKSQTSRLKLRNPF